MKTTRTRPPPADRRRGGGRRDATADISDIADADGLDRATFIYQWVRHDGALDGTNIGTDSASYTVAAVVAGGAISVEVASKTTGGSRKGRREHRDGSRAGAGGADHDRGPGNRRAWRTWSSR